MSLKTEQEEAEREFLDSQHAITDEYNRQAEELKDFQKPLDQATDSLKEQADRNQQLNQATSSRSGPDSYIQQANFQQANMQNMLSNYQDTLKSKIAQRDERNRTVIALKEQASEAAKMKYDLATQKRSQAQANITNAAKTLSALGCMLPFPFNLIVGGGSAIAGAITSAVI